MKRLIATACLVLAASAHAQAGSSAPSSTGEVADNAADAHFAVHTQATLTLQSQPPFAAPYGGANSLLHRGDTRETFDITLFVGVRPWRGLEVWINPELDQGFGLANTLGAAGFPSAEAYKVGKAYPYQRLQRAFARQTIDLGGGEAKVDADLNQFAGTRTNDRLVLTAGKISVGDLFDTNQYAHDPRGDFLNWAAVDAGTFDYAADAWGYTTGAAAELYVSRFVLRGGVFNLGQVPNSENQATDFSQLAFIAELEHRHTILGQDGKVAVTAFFNHAKMARLRDAVAYAQANGGLPNPVPVRHFATRPGVSVNLEQAVASGVGLFARAGIADGRYEAYEFTDIDRTVSFGAALDGKRWHRERDKAGIALIDNQASRARLDYLAAGGLGILIGDGRLPHPGDERIAEVFYELGVAKGAHLTLDGQIIDNPAYNRDRGPVEAVALRLHGQF